MSRDPVVALDRAEWAAAPSGMPPELAENALESGSVLFLPSLSFEIRPDERPLFSAAVARAKNVSFDAATGRVDGTVAGTDLGPLRAMLDRFGSSASTLVGALCPGYRPHLTRARASFRPVEIAGRATSWRRDDTRLHVDAFPSVPVQGARILRVFSNVNPDAVPRVWRLGEPFADVARRFAPRLRMPMPGTAALLRLLRITKSLRSPYDALMLQLHDAMKADMNYQTHAAQDTVRFPAGSTWIAFTDQVSHAVTSGQHQVEQTFVLPVRTMRADEASPLRVLEKLKRRRLT